MRGRATLPMLAELVKLRALQYQSAVAQAAEAAAVLQAKEDVLEDRIGSRAAAEDGWLALTTAPSLDVERLRWWSTEIARCNHAVGRATVDVARATTEVARCGQDMHRASQRRDLMERLFRRVRAAKTARREEDALQDNLDGLAYRRSAL